MRAYHTPHGLWSLASLQCALVPVGLQRPDMSVYPTTHTQNCLCGAVLVGGGSDSDFCLTGPRTHSILVYNSCYSMSEGTTRTEGPPCKVSKPRLSVRPRSGPCWATWPPRAIRRA